MLCCRPWIEDADVAKKDDKVPGRKKPAADGENANDRYNRGRELMISIEWELRARALDESAKKVAAEAEAEYKAAIAIDSNHGRAHIMLGMLCQMTGRHAEAEPHLRYGMGLPLGSRDWYIAAVTLANSYMEQERAADAAKVLEDITSAGSNDVLDLYKLGVCYTELGRADDAERVLRRGLAESPGHPQLTQALAALGKSPDPALALPPEIAAKLKQGEKLAADMQEKMKAILDDGGSPESIQEKIAAAQVEYQAAVTKLYNP
jgi:tetratricopeptide (TPR) repeat protein